MATMHPIRKQVAAQTEIPDKLYFRIGDVARLLEVPAYVLRFWETEFTQLKPNKGGTGQRLYRKKDVEMALRIKSLLYDQGFTIPGARQVFKAEAAAKTAAAVPFAAPETAAAALTPAVEPDASRDRKLSALRGELRQLLATLSRPVAQTDSSVERARPMRPRLVLEPSSRTVLFPVRQAGLFAADEDPGPRAG